MDFASKHRKSRQDIVNLSCGAMLNLSVRNMQALMGTPYQGWAGRSIFQRTKEYVNQLIQKYVKSA